VGGRHDAARIYNYAMNKLTHLYIQQPTRHSREPWPQTRAEKPKFSSQKAFRFVEF